MARRKKTEPETAIVLASSLQAMADNIAKVSEVGRAIKNSRLKEAAILTLMKDLTGEPKATIKKILDALPELEKQYLK